MDQKVHFCMLRNCQVLRLLYSNPLEYACLFQQESNQLLRYSKCIEVVHANRENVPTERTVKNQFLTNTMLVKEQLYYQKILADHYVSSTAPNFESMFLSARPPVTTGDSTLPGIARLQEYSLQLSSLAWKQTPRERSWVLSCPP